MGVSSQINYYEKKAIDQRVRYTQKQCAVLSDQIVMNGFRNYNMSSLSDEAGENVFEVEQLANNLEGRILLVDSRFKILADTYNRNCGKYLVTKETIHAMKGEEVAYRYIGKQYLQVITPIQDKNNDKSDVRGLIIAMVSLQNCNEMSEYLYDQRDNLVGIFFIITLIFSVLVALLIRNNFRRMQNELDIIAAGHQEEGLGQENFREFYNLSSSFNKIINRYKELENTRQEFVSNVSHELKTPIALIQGYAEGLKEGITDDPESMEFYCDVIMDEANKMNTMVKRLLTLNQIEFGNDEPEMERFDINELIASVADANAIRAGQKNMSIVFDNRNEHNFVWADEYKTEEVLTNYISNALNHCDGKRAIEVRTEKSENGGTITVTVYNSGKNIDDEDLERIWEKFYKTDKARTREYGGNGIGLSIVKAIMDSMGQEYGVRNVSDGVEFWFNLDCKS